jgi:hypothetical protein
VTGVLSKTNGLFAASPDKRLMEAPVVSDQLVSIVQCQLAPMRTSVMPAKV